MKTIIFLFFLTFSVSSIADDASEAAENLLTIYEVEKNKGWYESYCHGYIQGYYDGDISPDYDDYPDLKYLRYCMPDTPDGMRSKVSYTQMIKVFILWGQNNPDKLHYDFWRAVRQSFIEAWPCE